MCIVRKAAFCATAAVAMLRRQASCCAPKWNQDSRSSALTSPVFEQGRCVEKSHVKRVTLGPRTLRSLQNERRTCVRLGKKLASKMRASKFASVPLQSSMVRSVEECCLSAGRRWGCHDGVALRLDLMKEKCSRFPDHFMRASVVLAEREQSLRESAVKGALPVSYPRLCQRIVLCDGLEYARMSHLLSPTSSHLSSPSVLEISTCIRVAETYYRVFLLVGHALRQLPID
jgi:hypothetical protein